MKRNISFIVAGALMLIAATGSRWYAFGQRGEPAHLDAEKIATAAGSKATTTKDGVVRLAWARTDVKVTVDGLAYQPFGGLGSWAAFTPTAHGAMVMGDTVVFQDEVTPAIDAAFANGLEVTGLHNHFFFDEPKVYFMHIGGQGDPEKLAKGVKGIWEAIKNVRSARPEPAIRFTGEVPKPGRIDAGALDNILGHNGDAQNGVVKYTIGREGKMHGVKVGGSMGLTTWAAFSGSDEQAAVAGDFIMTAHEVQPVLRALRKGNLHVVALHTHGKEPAYKSKPKYCLVVFGPEAKTRVWLVMDGDTLYVDRNGDSDLTAKDERFLKNAVNLGIQQYEVGIPARHGSDPFCLQVEGIPAHGAIEPAYRIWCRPKGKGLLQRTDGVLLFADRPQEAPVVHFGGPLTLTIRDWHSPLQPRQLVRDGRDKELSILVGTPVFGGKHETFATVYESFRGRARDGLPLVELEFPATDPSAKPSIARAKIRYCQ